jgi:Cys-tRNA(Pro)/Cys-tRNA(Cys) deacylase
VRTSVDVHNALVERDVPHELVPVRGRLRKPDRIPAVLGLSPEEVGRVTLFEGGGRVVAALTSIARKADANLVAAAAGFEKCREVRAARTSALTGFLSEALPPAGLPGEIRVLLDEPLAAAEVVYFPGGEASSVLKVRGTDLVRATGATIAPLSREP